MSDEGLFEFGGYEIPSTLIAESGYECIPSQRQDLDPYTDQYGVTHRNALAHTKTQVTITTRPNLTHEEVQGLISGIVSHYENYRERSASCRYFDTESFSFKTGYMYLDPSFSTTIKTWKKRFDSIKLIFIEN